MTCGWCHCAPCAPWCIDDINKRLVAARWPEISPWWWNVIREVEYWRAHGVRNYVVRAGRRAGKSSTVAGRIAVREVLSDMHQVPPGDTGYFAILSADKDQAQERLETCHEALKALGIAHRKTANEITLTDRNVGVKAFAATEQAVVSFTCIGYLCDEVARWRDRDTGQNPARKIITSLRATMLTMKSALGWYVSAPWSTLDEHHAMVEAGSNENQRVFIAPTWIANPTVTEEETHRLEPDFLSWQREYAAIPMSSDETKFFSAEFVDAAARSLGFDEPYERITSGGDFAFRRNSSAMVALAKMGDNFSVLCGEERIPGARPLVPSKTISDLAGIAIAHGADSLCCDLHYVETVRETIEKIDLPLVEYPTTNEGNASAYIRVRVLLTEGRLDLANAPPKLIEQLKETTSRPTITGMTISNKVREGAHGDLVSALVAAVWASDQEPPERGNFVGGRRFQRYGDIEVDELTDLPPPEWDD